MEIKYLLGMQKSQTLVGLGIQFWATSGMRITPYLPCICSISGVTNTTATVNRYLGQKTKTDRSPPSFRQLFSFLFKIDLASNSTDLTVWVNQWRVWKHINWNWNTPITPSWQLQANAVISKNPVTFIYSIAFCIAIKREKKSGRPCLEITNSSEINNNKLGEYISMIFT